MMAGMVMRRWAALGSLGLALVAGCSKPAPKAATDKGTEMKPVAADFRVDPSTATTITGTVRVTGKVTMMPKRIDMSEDPACVAAHKGGAVDESVMVGRAGGVANGFVWVKSGLEGKTFAVPATPVTIDQKGCWFTPRVMGIQVGQELTVVNSDPVTHNIHPMAEVNREWNHSQGPGDKPLERKFLKPEVMIKIKCNIHSWMHAYLGVVDSPYFSVTGADGAFVIKNLPPGKYVVGVWTEALGTEEQTVTTEPGKAAVVDFKLKGR